MGALWQEGKPDGIRAAADALARAIAAVTEDQNLRSRLVENDGPIAQQMPTWDEIAARFVEVLQRAAGDAGAVGCNLTRGLANAGSRVIVIEKLSSVERE
ncbi:MAG: hypothetical protein ABSH01_16175 [Terriglobia bacterium]|jgi:hypothetical protein